MDDPSTVKGVKSAVICISFQMNIQNSKWSENIEPGFHFWWIKFTVDELSAMRIRSVKSKFVSSNIVGRKLGRREIVLLAHREEQKII